MLCVLEFNKNAYDFSMVDDALSFERSGDYELKIYYENFLKDNTDLEVSITNLDSDEVEKRRGD